MPEYLADTMRACLMLCVVLLCVTGSCAEEVCNWCRCPNTGRSGYEEANPRKYCCGQGIVPQCNPGYNEPTSQSPPTSEYIEVRCPGRVKGFKCSGKMPDKAVLDPMRCSNDDECPDTAMCCFDYCFKVELCKTAVRGVRRPLKKPQPN